MNTKLNKLNKDIEKAEQKVRECQDRLRALQDKVQALNKEKMEIENLAMIDFLRKNRVQQEDLKTIVNFLHDEKGELIPLKNGLTEVKTLEDK